MDRRGRTPAGFADLARVDFSQPRLGRVDTDHMPRKTIRLSEREFERWQNAAELAGVSLSELIIAAAAVRVEQLERDHAADLELDRHVREQVDAAIAERSAIACACRDCANAATVLSEARTTAES